MSEFYFPRKKKNNDAINKLVKTTEILETLLESCFHEIHNQRLSIDRHSKSLNQINISIRDGFKREKVIDASALEWLGQAVHSVESLVNLANQGPFKALRIWVEKAAEIQDRESLANSKTINELLVRWGNEVSSLERQIEELKEIRSRPGILPRALFGLRRVKTSTVDNETVS